MGYHYPYPHDTIVTPDIDPDRFTAEETALFRRGRCGWVTEYGNGAGPAVVHCGKPSKPGASFGNCAGHDAELMADHWPDGTSRY